MFATWTAAFHVAARSENVLRALPARCETSRSCTHKGTLCFLKWKRSTKTGPWGFLPDRPGVGGGLAVRQTDILLHPPLPLLAVST